MSSADQPGPSILDCKSLMGNSSSIVSDNIQSNIFQRWQLSTTGQPELCRYDGDHFSTTAPNAKMATDV